MVFCFGSTRINRNVLQKPYGPCTKCDGRVNLQEETQQFFLFCCCPLRPTTVEMVECPQCGAAVKAIYYEQADRGHEQASTL
jgi:endogenous inhibitor of DNA gyrase (YacG/DUF329 family)